jgi:hypothetical protein
MGWRGGSRGKVRRMRARPVVPVELAWRWGRNSRHELAGVTQEGSTAFHHARGQHTKNFFGFVVKRRGGQNNPLWRETIK